MMSAPHILRGDRYTYTHKISHNSTHPHDSISFPAFAKAAASQLKELEGDVEALKEENRSLLEETTGVHVAYVYGSACVMNAWM